MANVTVEATVTIKAPNGTVLATRTLTQTGEPDVLKLVPMPRVFEAVWHAIMQIIAPDSAT
jgi:hypothetical protein